MNGKSLKALIKLAGIALVVVACVYVAKEASKHPDMVGQFASFTALKYLFAGLISAACGDLCLALAWMAIVRDGRSEVSRFKLYIIYVTTQFGKYIPGNVLHFAGRYALGLKSGLPHSSLSAGLLLEPLGLLTTGGLLSLPFLMGLSKEWLPLIPVSYLIGGLIALSLVGLICCMAAVKSRKLRSMIAKFRDEISRKILPRLPLILTLYALYFVFQYISVTIALRFSLYEIPADVNWRVFGATVMSWLAGYLVLGAPGGIGIREFVMIKFLPFIPSGTLLGTVLFWRFISLFYDFFAFCAGSAVLVFLGRKRGG